MRVAIPTALVLVLAGLGCTEKSGSNEVSNPPVTAEQPKAKPDTSASAVKPLDKKTFGSAITEKDSVPLPDLLAHPRKFASQTVRTEGKVTAVCKSMGCWMEIGDDTGQAHIKMAGHSFFVPRESSGHRARVQGKVISAGAEEGACGAGDHDNCREQAQKETGRVASIEIEATGVEFLD